MLKKIKKELLDNPEKLKELLEYFNFYNVHIHQSYISFGRAQDTSKKSIVVRLEKNDYLYVTDYARNISKDLFSYISEQRLIDFKDVIGAVRNILGVDDFGLFNESRGIFGGFYEKIRKRSEYSVRTYDESILDKYIPLANKRFINDNISIAAQQFFGIRYDVESQGIVIPIHNQIGELIGAKVRCNYEVQDGEMKYYYLIPCQASQTLYGYSQNYNYLTNNIIYIYEAEKSIMQCFSYGIRNCVALGSGSISRKQVRMLLELNPKKIIFMHDVGYDLENILRNINMVKNYSRFSEVELGYWDFFDRLYDNKVSASDLGKKELLRIMDTEIKMIGDDEDEEEL